MGSCNGRFQMKPPANMPVVRPQRAHRTPLLDASASRQRHAVSIQNAAVVGAATPKSTQKVRCKRRVEFHGTLGFQFARRAALFNILLQFRPTACVQQRSRSRITF